MKSGLQGLDLVHSTGMSASFKRRLEKGLYYLTGQPGISNTSTDAQNIGIIMLPGHAGNIYAGTNCGPDTGYLIGGYSHTHTRSANQNTPCFLGTYNLTGHDFGYIRVSTGSGE